MFIIDAIPLTYLPISQPQILSYFCKFDLKRGSIIEAPLGHKNLMAIVLNSAPIASKKAVLKKADFTLRPINKVISSKRIIPSLFFLLADFISRYYFCPLSLSLKIILPRRIKSLINYVGKLNLETIDSSKRIQLTRILKTKNKNLAFGENFVSRFARNEICFSNDFPGIIRKIKYYLNHQKQVLVLVPTVFYQNYYFSKLSSEIPQPLFIASNDLKVKEFNSLWTKVDSSEAQLVIGRRSAPFLPWNNLGFIVVIDGDNNSYKSWDQRPYYNSITLINYLASFYNATITCYQNY